MELHPLVAGFCGACKPADRRPPWQWCEEHVSVDETSPMPGRWRSDASPWVRAVMEDFSNNTVRDIAVQCAAQSAKTQTVMNCACWAIAEDPGPAMWVTATKDELRDFVRDRLAPTFEACRPVKSRMGEPTLAGFTFEGMPFYAGWSGSKARLQSKPIRWLFCDEVRNYPPGRLEMVLKRTRSFWNSRRFLISTPGTKGDAMDTAFRAGDQRVWHFECPNCHQLQPLKFEQLKWDSNDTTKPEGKWRFDALADTVRYECVACRHQIKDTPIERRWIENHGQFVRTNPNAPKSRVSYTWNALLPHWVEWRAIVEEFLAAVDAMRIGGDIEPMFTFVTETLGEPWDLDRWLVTGDDYLQQRKADYDFGDPWPLETVRFLAADRQARGGEHYFWVCFWVCRAFGAGGASRLVGYGRCNTVTELAARGEAWRQATQAQRRSRVKSVWTGSLLLPAGCAPPRCDPANGWLSLSSPAETQTVNLRARIRDETAAHDTMLHSLPGEAVDDSGCFLRRALKEVGGRRLQRGRRALCDLAWKNPGMNAEDTSLTAQLKERLRFETLIADLSSQFVNVPAQQVDREIEDAQRRVCELLGIDLCGLWQWTHDTPRYITITHLYRPLGGPPPPDRIDGEEMAPWCLRQLMVGRIVAVDCMDSLPPEAARDKAVWCHYGIKSALVFPLSAGGQLFGVVTFNTVREERRWPVEIVNRLTVIAQVFANALARKVADEALRTSMAENERLRERLQAESEYLKAEIKVTQAHGDIIGSSPAIRQVLSQVEQVAPTDSTVLICGETGTGKELIAQAIQRLSRRQSRVMVKVNCAALPPALVESELFGREKGAFTGALTKQIGRFEIADGSTIFLDEIGELSREVQAKLLRVLQEGQFERLGSPRTVHVNVRIIAATNRDLGEEIRKGCFREDLYYRLSVFPIWVPPLREHVEDIPALAWAFLEEFSARMGKKITQVPRKTMEALQRHSWPGNVRELRNVIEHAAIVTTGDTLNVPMLKEAPSAALPMRTLADSERETIARTLQKTNWRIKGAKGAAALLGLNPSTLYSRMQKLGIPHRRQKEASAD